MEGNFREMKTFVKVMVFAGCVISLVGASYILECITGLEMGLWLEMVCLGHISSEVAKKVIHE